MLSRGSQSNSKASSGKYTAQRSRDLHPCMIYTTEHKITASKGTPPEIPLAEASPALHWKCINHEYKMFAYTCFRQPLDSAKSPSVRCKSHSLSLFIAATIRGIPKLKKDWPLALLGSVCTLSFREAVSTSREVQENREDCRAVTSQPGWAAAPRCPGHHLGDAAGKPQLWQNKHNSHIFLWFKTDPAGITHASQNLAAT